MIQTVHSSQVTCSLFTWQLRRVLAHVDVVAQQSIPHHAVFESDAAGVLARSEQNLQTAVSAVE